MFQTMASKDHKDQSLYEDDSDYSNEGLSDYEYEDQPTEHESDISSDEHDDQGCDDDYAQYSDYVEIEEEPLRSRASRNVQGRSVGSVSQVSGDPQAGPSAALSSHNVAFIGSTGDQQFEDASSPEKQPAENSQRSRPFSLRSMAAKRSYQERENSNDPDDPDSPPAQRRPGGFALRSLE